MERQYFYNHITYGLLAKADSQYFYIDLKSMDSDPELLDASFSALKFPLSDANEVSRGEASPSPSSEPLFWPGTKSTFPFVPQLEVLSILSHILIGALPTLTPASASLLRQLFCLLVDIILRHLLKLPLLRLCLPLLQSLLGVHVPQPPPAHVSTGIEIGLDRYRWSGEIYDSVLAVEELDKHLVDSGDFHSEFSGREFSGGFGENSISDGKNETVCWEE
nr:hypothetical protein Iba_chr04cCG16100 [Ipomoea batatas]